jgi:hypothetical protein
MPALETSSDFPPALPGLHDGGNGIEEQRDAEKKIQQEQVEKGNRVQCPLRLRGSHVLIDFANTTDTMTEIQQIFWVTPVWSVTSRRITA